MSAQVRVRFAPSPTGPLHIGGVRTALFNFLFAKRHGGDFILRIEDTDQARFVEGAEDYIIEALNWCNIPFDEGPGKEKLHGPYKQSERKEIYRKYAQQLIDSGHAYYAFDTSDQLTELRTQYEKKGETFIYNWHNRHKLNNSLTLTQPEIQKKLDSGQAFVVRFKVPENQEIILQDEIRGKMKVNTQVLDDKVLFKSDGMPTYHLANIVDDHLMEISHVIRGEEWLPSLPLHQLLYQAFGWGIPKFAHLPLILKPQGKGKLSKRDGDKLGFPVFPLAWTDPKTGEKSIGYREEGYLPEAVINMLAFLGWNEGEGSEKQFYSLEELIKAFSLQHVSKGGSKFDPEKTKWFQHHYLQEASIEKLVEDFQKILAQKNINPDRQYLQKVIELIRERATFVSDFWEQGEYFFLPPESYDSKAMKKAWKPETPELMKELTQIIEGISDYNQETVEKEVKNWITSKEIGFGKIMQPFRLSLVGSMHGPDVFAIASLIGKEETLSRIQRAVDQIVQ